jgi:hypothetical protein
VTDGGVDGAGDDAGDDGGPNLIDQLTLAAEDLPGVERHETADGSIEWRLAGKPFAAARHPNEASYLLDPAVAAAALRTADTEASTRGRDWVTFRPAVLDRFAIDRATAWLESAWRRADSNRRRN